MASREELILKWLERVERSGLSAPQFFMKHRVPFSLAQFYRYRMVLEEKGIEGLADGRGYGNHRELSPEAEGFLVGYVEAHPEATQERVREVIRKHFGVTYDPSGVWHVLQRMGWTCQKPERRARERDEQAIAAWYKKDLPRIKKRSSKR